MFVSGFVDLICLVMYESDVSLHCMRVEELNQDHGKLFLKPLTLLCPQSRGVLTKHRLHSNRFGYHIRFIREYPHFFKL